MSVRKPDPPAIPYRVSPRVLGGSSRSWSPLQAPKLLSGRSITSVLDMKLWLSDHLRFSRRTPPVIFRGQPGIRKFSSTVDASEATNAQNIHIQKLRKLSEVSRK